MTFSALHAQALGTLREMIVTGELKAGERLAEAAVCDLLGISRTPLREALKLLAAEGLVELRPNRGATIAPLHEAEIAALFEAVSGIERIAAELAAKRMTPPEISRLHALQARMEEHFERGQRSAYFRLNQEIHQLIVAGAKNEVLTSTHAILLARAERARYLALDTQDRWDQSVDEHRQILKALEQGRAEDAGKLLGEHVARTGAAVSANLKNGTAS
ncbi:transcriptional regulator [Mesorhizobium sp. L-8-3]|nr:transcriptional regulator [Mesorhizobium sp. L-8-3]